MRLQCLLLACSTLAFSQSFEASVSGGQSVFPAKSATIGEDPANPGSPYKMKDGFRLGFRLTLNSWRFMGHEFGYAYSRTGIQTPAQFIDSRTGASVPAATPGAVMIPAASTSLPSHQGFYDFLVYAAPEGFRVRPFAAGGVQFTAFSQPGAYYGNRETKYGINYGGGLKVKLKENWGIRLDVRQYNMGKPFKLANASGRLLMWEFSGGVAFLL